MKRKIIEVKSFSKLVDSLLKRKQLLKDDYDAFKKELATNPEKGDVIVGTGEFARQGLNRHQRVRVGVLEYVITI